MSVRGTLLCWIEALIENATKGGRTAIPSKIGA
jgi:hypothetical protein